MEKSAADAVFEALFRQAVIDNFDAEIAAIPPIEELEKMYPPTARREAQRKKLFRAEWQQRVLNPLLRRVVIILVVLGTMLCGVLLTEPEVRAAVGDTMVKWYDGFTEILGIQSADENGMFEPLYLPEGYEQKRVMEIEEITRIEYVDAAGSPLFFSFVSAVRAFNVDNDFTEYDALDTGVLYHIFQPEDSSMFGKVIWENMEHSFLIEGCVPMEELIRMAKSVQ